MKHTPEPWTPIDLAEQDALFERDRRGLIRGLKFALPPSLLMWVGLYLLWHGL